MKCKDCQEARRHMNGSVSCILYGMIIDENHECTREGGKRNDGAADQRNDGESEDETGEDGRGAVGTVQKVL